MKRTSSVLLVLLVTLLLGLGSYMSQSLLSFWLERLESLPVTVFLYNEYEFDETQAFIENDRMLSLSKAELNVDMLNQMSDKYGIYGVDDVVSIDDLPHVIQAYPAGNYFGLSRFNVSMSRLKRLAGNEHVFYPEDSIQSTYIQLRRQRLVGLFFHILAGSVLFLLAFYSGKVYLSSTSMFWKLFFDMGGVDKRYNFYLKESLLRVYLPFILPIVTLYVLDYSESLEYQFDVKIWLLMFVITVLGNQTSWLTHKEV